MSHNIVRFRPDNTTASAFCPLEPLCDGIDTETNGALALKWLENFAQCDPSDRQKIADCFRDAVNSLLDLQMAKKESGWGGWTIVAVVVLGCLALAIILAGVGGIVTLVQ